MKAADFLAQTRQLPLASREDLTGNAPIVVLSPHPDDETLGMGGLIKQATDAGQQVDVVLITDGAGSHPHSAMYPPIKLVALRKQEVLDAASLLGLPPSSLHHLDLPDAQTPRSGPDFDVAVQTVTDLMTRRGARNLFVTWQHDPHCDHETAAAMAEAAITRVPEAKLWSYPIWGWHLDPDAELPGAPGGYRLDIAGQQAVKARAIAAHRSQMTDLIADDPDGFRFTDKTLAPFLGSFEYYLERRT
ncbi:MAG: PIG-L family deacetylase [Tardiphaga sp.]